MAIGDIRPQEDEATEVEVLQVAAAPISADVPDATLQQTPAVTLERGSATLEGGSAAPTQSAAADLTLARGQNLQPIFEQDDDEDPEDEQESIEHPRLRFVTSVICEEIEGLQMAREVVYIDSITSSTTSLGTPSTQKMEQPQILMAM